MTKYVSEDGQELNFWSSPNLPKVPKRVAVSMSSGCDSTMALILLCEEFKDRSLDIFPAVGEDINRASNAVGVKKILEQVRLLYPMHNIHEPAIYPYDKLSPNYTRKVPVKEHCDKFECELIVAGKTLQPPHINVDNRTPSSTTEFTDSPGKNKMYCPLFSVNKRMVASLYRQFDLMDTIYPLTVSCVDMMLNNPVPCKKCSWCQEKKWAFGTYDFGIC